jgi:hypothetical protein
LGLCSTEEELEILYRSLTKVEIDNWQIVITIDYYNDKLSYFI